MRKEYGQALRKLFQKGMKEAFPEFRETKVSSPYFWPGDRGYRWSAVESLQCWIVLSPSGKDRDEFNVLVGWSTRGRYPELSMVPCLQRPSPERREFECDEYLTRLPCLWSDHDPWWVVREFRLATSVAELEMALQPIPGADALAQVGPQVEDALQKLKAYGVPYLQERCRIAGEGRFPV